MKKGFTLTELIAVIAILSLLILLATGIFINMQRVALEGQYSNVLIDIENKAEEYARDISTTDVLYINVDFLIKNGYIQGDEGNLLYDPRDNSVMNCYMIHIVLKDGVYEANLLEDENLMNEDGTCDVTHIETGTVGLLCNDTNCSSGWYDRDITLSIKGLSEEDILNSKVEWTSLLGTYVVQNKGEEKVLEVSPNTVLNTTYNVTITTPEETYHVTQNILIDKENPIIVSAELPVSYTGTQYLEIDANDVGGSGISGYAITDKDCETLIDSDFSSTNVSVNQSGTLYVCAKDNAGNIGSYELNVAEVTFDYNNTSSNTNTEIPVYYLEQNTNYPLLEPTRNGYTFNSWVDENGDRVYGFENLENGDRIEATWDIIDVDIPTDKIDKDTVGVTIENKINMILVLDVSGSMSGSDLSNLKEVSNNLINSMSFQVGSTISIIEFESSASILLENRTSASEATRTINGLRASGGTDFVNALSKTQTILNRNNFNKEETFVIFVSDGVDSDYSGQYASTVRSMVNTVYAIGIGSGANATKLRMIASSGCYFNSSSGLESLSQIFTKIQEEIREEVTIRSVEGLIELPNLYVTTDYPFILNVGTGDLEFPSISSISDILTVVNGTYYLDLTKVDNKYKLDGNFSNFSFTYYYS